MNSNRDTIRTDTSDTIREDGSAGAYLLSGTPERTPSGKMVVLVAIFHHDYQQGHHQGCKDPEGYQNGHQRHQRTPTGKMVVLVAGAPIYIIYYIIYIIDVIGDQGNHRKGGRAASFFLLYTLYII